MNPEQINARLSEIESHKDDPEVAASIELSLYRDVLKTISEGAEKPGYLAHLTLYAEQIDFPRWHS